MDLGRRPEARFPDGEVTLLDREVTEADIAHVVDKIGSFGDDNRAGIERTLHRISAIRNRTGKIVGLTCRIGRAVYGTIEIIEDFVESGKSILIMGRPGIGKTTMLREAARVLADDLGKRVVVVDTSNEIAGDGDIPHPAIGKARRMQVRTPALQHEVMIEAVENHMPQVIVIDEIGTELEAQAARTIAERGVQLIGTAHGNNLDNLMLNPTLSDLIGGIQSVTLGDEEARRRRTQKSVLERKAPPTFDVIVEIQDRERVIVHADVAETVDAMLRGDPVAAGAALARRGRRPPLAVAAAAVAARAARPRARSPASSARAAAAGGRSRAGAASRAYRSGALGGGARRSAAGYRPGASAAGERRAAGRQGRAAALPGERLARHGEPGGNGGRSGGRRRGGGSGGPGGGGSGPGGSGGPAACPDPVARPSGGRRAGPAALGRLRPTRRSWPARSRTAGPWSAGAAAVARSRAPARSASGAPARVARAGRPRARGVQGGGGNGPGQRRGPRRGRRGAGRPRPRRGRCGRSRTTDRSLRVESAASCPTLRVLPHGISRKRLEQAIRELQLPVIVARDVDEADVVMTLRSEYRQKGPTIREAEERALPIYVLKANTIVQMQASLTSIFALEVDPREAALRETEEAIGLVSGASSRSSSRPRTPTSGGSSTRWPSGRTWSPARAAASRTAASGSTRTRRGPGGERGGGTCRRAVPGSRRPRAPRQLRAPRRSTPRPVCPRLRTRVARARPPRCPRPARPA